MNLTFGKKIMNSRTRLLTLVLFISLSILNFPMNDSTSASVNNKLAEVSAGKLQQKILLNDAQTAKIASILNTFINANNFSEANSKSSLDKVEAVLDQREKAKFDIIKSEWWDNFMKGLNKPKVK